MMSTLLIITNKIDPHADEVIRILTERGTVTPVRLNAEDFLTGCRYTFEWGSDGIPSAATLTILDSGRSADAVSVGWWRKPVAPEPAAALRDPEAARMARAEADAILRSFDAAFPGIAWVNDPRRMRAANNRLEQMAVAGRHGLKLPETLVTNRVDDLRDFVRRQPACIIKMMASGGFQFGGKQWGTFTSVLTPDALEEAAELVAYAPVVAQRQVTKHRELRVTVIGETAIACMIDTSDNVCADAQVDWRVVQPDRIPHRLVDIPPKLVHALQAIVQEYGLSYGAFDIIQEPDGQYYFIEMNPNGQYLWIEQLTGAPLSAAMCDLIEQLDHGTEKQRLSSTKG